MNRRAIALVVCLWLLTAARPAGADVGVIVLEPIKALGYFTRVGHAATYLSNICPDGSPVRMRLCDPGESGSVVSRYSPFSEHEDYDWALVPLDIYLHGFESPDLAPVIGTRKLQSVIEQHNFQQFFAGTLSPGADGGPPEGQWKSTLANRLGRSLYIFTVATTRTEDLAIVEAFNGSRNSSRFNFFYGNCSNQTKAIFDLILPGIFGDRVAGLSMETPKGLVKALVAHAELHPELRLVVHRYPQVPGTIGRSREILFPMENMYKSLGFAPYWFFGGFREVAFGAMFYHEVIAPFSLIDAAMAFASPVAARLSWEQRRLRDRQDAVQGALNAAVNRGRGWSGLASANARLAERLAEIRDAQRAELHLVAGSDEQWRARAAEFRSLVAQVARLHVVPDNVQGIFARAAPSGALSDEVLRYLETEGRFSADEIGPGPWVSVTANDGRRLTTGLSRAHVLSGEPVAAVLVLASAIDYTLRQAPMRREEMASADELLALFRRAVSNVAATQGNVQ